jgi:hypothetical protein
MLAKELEVTMTTGKTAAITTGFVAAFALGVFTSPYLMDRTESTTSTPVATVETDVPIAPAPPASSARASKSSAEAATVPDLVALPASTPAVQDRLKNVLRSGAKMDVASEGFDNAEQFATVAHASRNTEVPFMLLKHRVVEQGKSVESALEESNPELDASAEVSLARAQAREDMIAARMAGN